MPILKITSGLVERFICFGFDLVFKKPLKQFNFLKKPPAKAEVLSIEDNEICQKVNATHLERLGCSVQLVSTARAALEKLNLPYKIIFLDVNIPDCSTHVLINLIRNDEQNVNKNTPIIIMTSWFNESVKKNFLAVGANEIYSKPIAALDFKKILQTYKVIMPV